MCSQFKRLVTIVDFGCTKDHLALTYDMKRRTEPASTRIKDY